MCVLFIGEGQYGKVYTCISVDTGELMAMKEVSGLALWGPFGVAEIWGRNLFSRLLAPRVSLVSPC